MSQQHRLILEESSHTGPARVPPGETPAPPERANGIGLVVVDAGEGLIEIFRGLGADAIVEGGQSMNPSTQDMLTAVDELPYDDVLLLPNNKNVLLAAAVVVKLTRMRVKVL